LLECFSQDGDDVVRILGGPYFQLWILIQLLREVNDEEAELSKRFYDEVSLLDGEARDYNKYTICILFSFMTTMV
jgi:hypothetical protein